MHPGEPLLQSRRNCAELQSRIIFEIDCLASHLHRVKYARICLIVLRGIVGQLPNDDVGEVLWLLYSRSVWHGYPLVPSSVSCMLPIIPCDPSHSLGDLAQHRVSGTMVASCARQTVFRLAAMQRVQSLLLERLCDLRDIASDVADEAVSDWVEAVAVMEIPPATE